MTDIDTTLLITLVAAYFAAGIVKGVLGTGLPTVAVPIMSMVTPVPIAISLTAIPVVSSNIWQTLHGGHHVTALRRFWPLLVTMLIGCVISAWLLASVNSRATSTVLGILLLAYCLLLLMPLQLETPKSAEPWLGPTVGAFAGLLAGVLMMGPLLIIYLVSLRLSKDEFVSAIAMIFLIGTAPLYAVLIIKDVLSAEALLLSMLAAIPVMAGLVLGTHLRRRISQRTFQRLLVTMLFVVALNLIRKGISA